MDHRVLLFGLCGAKAIDFAGASERPLQMKLLERITMESGKCGGRPCIRGKRIRVSDILDLLSHGASHEEVLEDYPFLEPEDILAAIACASRITDHVVFKAGEGSPELRIRP